MTTHICDIVEVLKQSEGNQELSPNARARLVMQGIKTMVSTSTNQPYEEKMLGYLISQAEKYLKDPEAPEAAAIIAKGMQENLVYKDAA